MNNKRTHFAIRIDDIKRAKNFCDGVCNRSFQPYGQRDFWQISTDITGNGEWNVVLQSRQSPIPDKIMGLENTIDVENMDELTEKIKSYGGQVVPPKTSIPCMEYSAGFLMTEGNLICGIPYDNTVR